MSRRCWNGRRQQYDLSIRAPCREKERLGQGTHQIENAWIFPFDDCSCYLRT